MRLQNNQFDKALKVTLDDGTTMAAMFQRDKKSGFSYWMYSMHPPSVKKISAGMIKNIKPFERTLSPDELSEHLRTATRLIQNEEEGNLFQDQINLTNYCSCEKLCHK